MKSSCKMPPFKWTNYKGPPQKCGQWPACNNKAEVVIKFKYVINPETLKPGKPLTIVVCKECAKLITMSPLKEKP